MADGTIDIALEHRAQGHRRLANALLVAAVVCGSLATLTDIDFAMALLLSGGTTLALLGAVLHLRGRGMLSRADQQRATIRAFAERDAVPCFITNSLAEVQWVNRSGATRFGNIEPGETGISTLLSSAARDIGSVSLRLLARAEAGEDAIEDLTTTSGHARVSVHFAHDDTYFWRFEEFPDKRAAEHDAGPSLPLVTAGRNGTVLHMNEAARALVGMRAKTLDKIFTDLPPKLGEVNVVATHEGPKPCIVAQAEGKPGRSEYVLLPVSDVSAPLPPGRGPDITRLPVPIMTVNRAGEILSINGKARKLISVEEVEGTLLWDHMEGLGRPLRDWLIEAAEGRNLNRTEFLLLKRPDKEIFVQVTLARVDAPQADQPELYVVLNDATELKTLEAQFVQSQKMQAIGQLAGGVAHDFNNLLTAITGHCDLLLLRHDQGDPDYADLVQINQNANRAAALVGQLLAFSRKQTLKAEPLDLRDTVSDLTHLLDRLVGEKVELVLSHDPKLNQIRADKRQLEQVLMNLVVNARDAMKEGGKIEIETANLKLSEATENGSVHVPPGDYVLVKVRDEGPGIPADKIDKVFEPFFTTKRVGEGTGLGLSTAYGIVKQTGGFIFVDSAPGQGAEFTLLFPAHFPDAQVADPAQHALSASREGTSNAAQEGVVLLVEDEAPVRAFASRALKLKGFTVLEADSGEAALNTLGDGDLKIDVFVTDVVMPGLDGPSWVRKALDDRPGTRVVFISGYAEDALQGDREPVPNSTFLPKPFSLTELTDTVARQIG